MKQDYFEDRLKELLEQGEEHPFAEGEWRRLDRRLRAAEGPKTPIWLTWLPIAFLLLLGGTLWQHFALSGKIAQLELSLSDNTLQQRDTVRNTVILYDTLIREVILDQESSLAATTPVSREEAPRTKYPYNSLAVATERLVATLPDFKEPLIITRYTSGTSRTPGWIPSLMEGTNNRFQADNPLSNRTVMEDEEPVYPVTLAAAQQIAPGQMYYLNVPATAFPTLTAPAYPPLPPAKAPFLHRLKPRSYTLDGYVGSMRETKFLGNDDGLALGLGLTMGFTDRLSLRIGLDHLARSFGLNEDQVGNYSLPTVAPLSPDDEIESATGTLILGQIPLGLQVEILEAGDWNFFAEAGGIASFGLPSNVSYTLEDDQDDTYTLTVDNILDRSLKVQTYYGTLGLRYRVTDKWAIMIAGTRQVVFNQSLPEFDQPDFLRYRLGVRYRL